MNHLAAPYLPAKESIMPAPDTLPDLRLGMKIYDNAWFLDYGMSAGQLADFLAELGVSYIIAQSQYLPMQNNAVQSAVSQEQQTRYVRLDDLDLRRKLAERGILYFGCLNICFDPAFAARHPGCITVDQFGIPMQQQDWYLGIPPVRHANLTHKATLLSEATRMLQPDGIHLGFIRWPGFWETWLPDVQRANMPDYCYEEQTLHRFCADTDIDLPCHNAVAAARLIASHHRAAWRDWKCGITVEAIRYLKNTVQAQKPDTRIAINTLPFSRNDFDNAVEEVFGQDIHRLSEVVDIFEVMAYHQILRRDEYWPAAISRDIASRTAQQVICTLQARPLYLDGPHSGRSRSAQLSADEFGRAVQALADSPVDGLCVFTLSDFLAMRNTQHGRDMLALLRQFRR